MLLWVNIIAHALLAMVLPNFLKRPRYLGCPRTSLLAASGSPTACLEDFGADEVSQGSSHLRAQSLFSVLRSFDESEARGCSFVHPFKAASLQRKLFENVIHENPTRFPPTSPLFRTSMFPHWFDSILLHIRKSTMFPPCNCCVFVEEGCLKNF